MRVCGSFFTRIEVEPALVSRCAQCHQRKGDEGRLHFNPHEKGAIDVHRVESALQQRRYTWQGPRNTPWSRPSCVSH